MRWVTVRPTFQLPTFGRADPVEPHGCANTHEAAMVAFAKSWPRNLAHVSPWVFLLDRLIGNFLERVLVRAFVILLLPLFFGYLLVAFLAELATMLAVSRLGVRGHRQYRDHRSYHKSFHLDGSLTARNAREANIRIVANPPPRFSKSAIRARNTPARAGRAFPENNVEGVYAAFRQPKIQRARTLGVSIMTLHRWRQAPPWPQSEFVAIQEAGQPDRTRGGGDRIAELQLKNSRLRRVVTKTS